ncbi:MAG: sigma-54 dependent transcriptional regulator [Planctomycetota bacterium]
MDKILIVDDESNVRTSIEEMLDEAGYDVVAADRAEGALKLVEIEQPDLMICDVQMPGMNGLEAFRVIRQSRPRMPVIIMTGYGTTETAIEATKLGAFDYLLKPFDPAEMLTTVQRALESVRLMQRHVVIDPMGAADTGDALIGQSASMQQVYKSIGRVAATDASVLIRGETGTGKELVARAVYQHSRRSEQPLRMVNCVAIPETLLESELFGYERGAFTGANSRRIGKFEQADGGTIFLDEIGDIPLVTQAKLLRVLQEKSFERIGSNETIRVDVRVIAATNRDLEGAIQEGKFREDLYHRLNVVTINIPPLRERGQDLVLLTRHFLRRFSKELKIEEPPLSEDALHELKSYSWPGNVRELEHCIQRAMIFTQGYPIQQGDIQRALQRSTDEAPSGTATKSSCLGNAIHVGMTLEAVEKVFLKMTLEATGGNKKEASQILGISRRAIYDKLRRHGML